jgi:thiamine-phosphate pyrophosphorylase
MSCDEKALRLYAVTDRTWLRGETLESQVEKALRGGVTMVQLREKNLAPEDFLREALEIKALCGRYRVPFLVNDDAELAVTVDAGGVHVGQGDLEAGEVRRRIGKDRLLGVSVSSVDQALSAERRGADYLGVGAVFPTASKDDAALVSREVLRAICRAVRIPVVAIGGIGRDNAAELSGSGICGIAVISAIFAQPDITAAAAELRALAERVAAAATEGKEAKG